MQIELGMSKGQVVSFVFGQDAVAASQTNVQLPAVGPEEGGTVDGYTVPFNYDVIAISATLTAAGSAGTLTVGATIGGTEDADSTMTVTTETDAYKRIPRGAMRGVAGDRLGCELTSDASWNGTLSDLLVTIFVAIELEDI